MYIRELRAEEINTELFKGFQRHQKVTKCWRKEEGQWVVKDVPFIDQWTPEDYSLLVECLKNTLATGGVVYGAFYEGELKGFTSVEGVPLGSREQYRDLSSLHVSEEMRGHKLGKKLFILAADWARNNGGEKLYISGHSAVETQAFYKSMGCIEAEEYNEEHVKREPYDCQLEYLL